MRLLRKTAMNENKKIADVAQSVITAGGAVQMTQLRIGFHSACRRDRFARRSPTKGFLRGRRIGCRAGARSVVVETSRDKLNIRAVRWPRHLIAPVAIASSLGLGPRQSADHRAHSGSA